MKTIKSIKAIKSIEVGTIRRLDDVEAESKVRGGAWKYVPKSEYKTMSKEVEKVIPEVKTKEDIIPGRGAQRVPSKKK